MANFSAGLPFNHSGYDILFQPVRFFRADPSRFISEFSDPRGLFRSGMVPADTISYRLYYRTVEHIASTIPSLAVGAAFGLGVLIGAPEVVLTRSKTRTAITFFEGRDVIDLPTKDLQHDGDAIVLPDKVYRVLHAGSEKFLQSKEDISRRASTVLTRLNKGQMEKLNVDPKEIDRILGDPDQVLKVAISPNAPFDMQKADPLFGRFFVDTASNKVRLKGSPQFISYVAVDRNLYRDVVTTTSSAQAIGIVQFNQPLLILNTSAGQTQTAYVMRFAFVDVSTDPDKTDFRWRLSESYNIAAGQAQATPSDLVANMSTEEVTRNSLASVFKHYVYDLADLSEDTTNEEFSTPIKNAFSPALARAKMDETSSYFDPKFKAQIVGFKLGLGATGTLVTPLAVGASTTQAVLFPEWEYTSAFYTPVPILGATARLGYEYTFWKSGAIQAVSVPNDVIILAKTRPAAQGIAAFRDPCIDSIDVFVAEDVATRREFFDSSWTEASDVPPVVPGVTKLEAFMAGEDPVRSSGISAMMPLQQEIGTVNAGTSGKITIPNDFAPTGIVVQSATGGGDQHSILRLFGDDNPTDQSTPIFELEIPNLETSRQLIYQFPPFNIKSYLIVNPQGSSVTGIIGAKREDFLPSLTTTGSIPEINQIQINAINEAEDWPIQIESLAAAIISTYGHAVMAYNNKERIDMGYRSASKEPFWPIRDVVLRVTDEIKNGIDLSSTTYNFPTASLPFLVADLSLGNLLLFYFYKKRILLKTIPIEIFTSKNAGTNDTKFTPEVEAEITAELQSLISVVAYDGGVNDKSSGIEVDLQFDAIAADLTVNGDVEPSRAGNIISYSACLTQTGNMFLFIEDDGRIRVRRSTDRGRSWVNALPSNFFFLPQLNSGGITNIADEGNDGESPFAYSYEVNGEILLFFFFQSSLLSMNIPEEVLTLPAEEAAVRIPEIKPLIIFGDVTDDMKARGIELHPVVSKRKDSLKDSFHEVVSPHQIAIAMTEGGYLRLFFKDDTDRLKSLISTNAGRSWQTEKDYIADRKRANS